MESHSIQHSSTTTSTTTNAISTEQEVVMNTMQPVVFLKYTTVDHKSISLHHTTDKSTAVKSSS